MQHILKDKTKKLESVFVQTWKDSEFCYSRLFEITQDGVLLLDAGKGPITDGNLLGLWTLTNMNEISSKNWAITPPAGR